MAKNIYKTYGIYGIKNNKSEKTYIGQTINNFGDRWDCHKAMLRGGYHYSRQLQEDWNKHGEEMFSFIVVRDCTGMTREEIDNAEKEEIAKIKSNNSAYNLHDGGHDGYFKGKHLSEETKRKIGIKNHYNGLGRKASDLTRSRMSSSQRARFDKWTDENRREWGLLMSKIQKGVKKPALKISLKGNKNGAKYSIEQVKEVKRLFREENKSNREISNIMDIPIASVGNITSGRRWADVE